MDNTLLDEIGGEGRSLHPLVALHRNRHDLAGKLLLKHPLALAALIQRVVPDLAQDLGREQPFAPADISLDNTEWVEASDPQRVGLTHRSGDIRATLHTDKRPVAIVVLELQSAYDNTMSERYVNYVSHAMQEARAAGKLVPHTSKVVPVVPILVHTGTSPWFSADRGTWLVGIHPHMPYALDTLTAFPVLTLDIAAWHRKSPAELTGMELTDIADVFIHLSLLVSKSYEWIIESRTYAAILSGLEPLTTWTLDLLARCAQIVRSRDDDANPTYWRLLVDLANEGLLPIWRAILTQDISKFQALEELAMAVDLFEDVQAVLERKLDITRNHLRTELRAEIQAEEAAKAQATVEIAVKAAVEAAMETAVETAVEATQVKAQVAALLSIAKFTGGLTEIPELEAYRAKLAEVALTQLPSQDDFGNYLLTYPEGEARVVAARRFLDDIF